MSREFRFTIEEIVEIHDPTHSIKLNGMVDVIQTTKGYAEIDVNGEVSTFLIDECIVTKDDGRKLINTDVVKDKGVIRKLIEMITSK